MTINHTIYLIFSGFEVLLKPHHDQQIFNKKNLHKKLITKALTSQSAESISRIYKTIPSIRQSIIQINKNKFDVFNKSSILIKKGPNKFSMYNRFHVSPNPQFVGHFLIRNGSIIKKASPNKSKICISNLLLTNSLQLVDLSVKIAARRRFVSKPQFILLCNFLLRQTTSLYKRNNKRLPIVYKGKGRFGGFAQGRIYVQEQENNLPFSNNLPISNISNKFKCQQFLLHKNQKQQKQNPQNKNCFNILKTINNCLNDKNLLEPNSSILLSISGGQDSICLFFLFEILKIQWNWKISIIYCNHLWQKNSFETQNQICKMGYYFTHNIYFTAITGQTNGWRIVSINPHSLSILFGTYYLKLPNHQKLIFSREIAVRGSGGKASNPLIKSKICSHKLALKNISPGNCSSKSSICRQLTCFTEQKARNWRYQLWQKLSIFYKYSFLITGHTATDRAETLLLNLIRGSGKRGVTSLQWNKKILKMVSCFFSKKQETIFKTTFLGYKKQFNVKNSYSFVLIALFKNQALRKLQFSLFLYLTFLNYKKKKKKLQEYIFYGQKNHLHIIAYQQIVAIRKKWALLNKYRKFVGEKEAKSLFFNLSGKFIARSVHKNCVENFTYRNSYFQILRLLYIYSSLNKSSILIKKSRSGGEASKQVNRGSINKKIYFFGKEASPPNRPKKIKFFQGKIYFFVPKENIIEDFRFASKIVFWVRGSGGKASNPLIKSLICLKKINFFLSGIIYYCPLTKSLICLKKNKFFNKSKILINKGCNLLINNSLPNQRFVQGKKYYYKVTNQRFVRERIYVQFVNKKLIRGLQFVNKKLLLQIFDTYYIKSEKKFIFFRQISNWPSTNLRFVKERIYVVKKFIFLRQIKDLIRGLEALPPDPLTLNNLLIRNGPFLISIFDLNIYELYLQYMSNQRFVQGNLSLKPLLNLGRKYKLYLYSSNLNCNHNKCEKDLSNFKQRYVTLIKINLHNIKQKLKIDQQLKFTYIYKKFISSPRIS